jgi:hypothetical protein
MRPRPSFRSIVTPFSVRLMRVRAIIIARRR